MMGRNQQHAFVSSEITKPSDSAVYAACAGTPCLLSSTISLLDVPFNHSIPDPTHLLENGERNMKSISSVEYHRYMSHSLASAVDGDITSYFMSPQGLLHNPFANFAYRSWKGAQVKEGFTLDLTRPVGHSWAAVEMAWVVSMGTADILSRCKFESSADAIHWVCSHFNLGPTLLMYIVE